MKKQAVRLTWFFLLPFCLCVLHAAEIIPVGDFRFLGGQHFFNGDPSSLSGNISLTYAPAVKFSKRFSLVPTYMGSYRGAKEVNDLAGGGMLFQDAQSHLLSVKGVYAPHPSLKLKLSASYRVELLRDAKDKWSEGLFDYHKLNTGFETEYFYLDRQSVRAGVDYFTLRFPNYYSMESRAQLMDMGREQAGKDTLDSDNLMTTLAFTNAFGALKTELGGGLTGKDYPDQPLYISDSDISADQKRKDTFGFVTAGFSYPFRVSKRFTLLASCDLQYISNDSNQGHADVKQADSGETKFIPDYYDYTASAFSPMLHFFLGKTPVAVSLGGSYNARNYKERLVQNEAGAYGADRVYVNETVYSVGLVYPLARSFKLRVSGNYIESRSNTEYNKGSFAYNYETSNYLMGFNYEF